MTHEAEIIYDLLHRHKMMRSRGITIGRGNLQYRIVNEDGSSFWLTPGETADLRKGMVWQTWINKKMVDWIEII